MIHDEETTILSDVRKRVDYKFLQKQAFSYFRDEMRNREVQDFFTMGSGRGAIGVAGEGS